VAIPEEQIRQVMEILTAWNPLGDKADQIDDLNSHRTEAIDVLFNISLRGSKVPATRIVQEVLNQAFDLSLSVEECTEAGRKILALIPEE